MNPTTELEAVNLMLSVIGEAPVNDLDTPATSDVAVAVRVLSEVNRDVQTFGWIFNTDKDVKLQKDGSGYIRIPPDAARVEVARNLYSDIDPVQRGDRLYDRKNRTYVFTKDVVVEKLVTLLDFSDLPQAARYYISVRASRIFADRVQGSDAIHAFSEKDEMWARRTLMKDQAEQADLNILGAPGVVNALRRTPKWVW